MLNLAHPRADFDGVVSKDATGDKKDGTPPDPAKQIVEDVKKHLDDKLANTVDKTDLQPLQQKINDLEQKVKDAQAAVSTVPATCRATNLKAFKSNEQAYGAAMILFAQTHDKLPQFRSPLTTKAVKWCEEKGLINKGVNQVEGINAQGGFLVYDQNSTEIIDLKESFGTFEPNVRVIQMTSDHFTMNRRVSGTTAYWVDELGAITPSNKTWDRITLTPKKLAQMTRYSSEINEDAVISIVDDLVREFQYQFDVKKDGCGWIGDGTSTYGGMTGIAVKIDDGTHTASVVTALSGNTGFETFDLVDLHSVVGKLPLYARTGAKWYVSSLGFATGMERLAHAGGGNTVTTIGGALSPAFLGYPVVITNSLNSVAGADVSKIKLLFGNLPMSTLMGIRRGITIATSSEKYFDTDELAVRGTTRFDINVHDLGDNTNAGPVIALKTPGS